MPGTRDVLQGIRDRGYGQTPAAGEERILDLSDEEAAAIPQGKPGEEVCISVYGTIEEDGFHVSRIEPEAAPAAPPEAVS